MPCAFRRRGLLLLLPPLLAACAAAPGAEQALGPRDFVLDHYAALRPGADWQAVQNDFTAAAAIARNDPQHPGALLIESAASFFATTGPEVDRMRAFTITPLALDVKVYDRLAAAWVYVEVISESPDGESRQFRAVDLLTLIRDESESWRITHLLYQLEAEDWPPPSGAGLSAFRRAPFSASVAAGYARW